MSSKPPKTSPPNQSAEQTVTQPAAQTGEQYAGSLSESPQRVSEKGQTVEGGEGNRQPMVERPSPEQSESLVEGKKEAVTDQPTAVSGTLPLEPSGESANVSPVESVAAPVFQKPAKREFGKSFSKIGKDDLNELLANWNGSELSEDGTRIVVRDRRGGGGSYSQTKGEFFDWLFSDKVFGGIAEDARAEWQAVVNRAREKASGKAKQTAKPTAKQPVAPPFEPANERAGERAGEVTPTVSGEKIEAKKEPTNEPPATPTTEPITEQPTNRAVEQTEGQTIVGMGGAVKGEFERSAALLLPQNSD